MPTAAAIHVPGKSLAAAVAEARKRAIQYLASEQRPNGCVVGEVVWCAILTSQYVIVSHIVGQPLSETRRRRCLRAFAWFQNADGGFGLHDESGSYLFVTTLAYVAMRLLGVSPADSAVCRHAKDWLDQHDVRRIPSWGKLWLAMLGLYGWEGTNPVPPEIWLLPPSLPIHPSRYYCHTRLIYLAFGTLYGRRATAPITPIVLALRSELYREPFEQIDFGRFRSEIAETDLYAPPGRALETAYSALTLTEHVLPGSLREKALDDALDRILFEERSTNFYCISPVNGMLNVLALHFAGRPERDRAYAGVDYWIWEDDDRGLRMGGASSHTWDTAFAVQAVCAAPDGGRPFPEVVDRMTGFLDRAQVRDELPDGWERYFRTSTRGGWCFGSPEHRWPVSDCAAEALLALQHAPTKVPAEWLRAGVEFVLARQNANGGFSSYEPQRGNPILEHVNPSEMYGNCMSEYSYVECTSSDLQALSLAAQPGPVAAALDARLIRQCRDAVARGARFIASRQRDDGAWPGFWGINYTYGTLFGTAGLLAAGRPTSDPAVVRAGDWLLSHQLPGGAWGESWVGCKDDTYVPHREAQVTQTAWALMALLLSRRLDAPGRAAIDRGMKLLVDQQETHGNWPRQSGAGIFFNTALLHYELYRTVFPIWALGLWQRSH